jgi:hypothetical protein
MKQVENGDANASNEQQLRKMDVVIRGSVPHQKRVEVMTDLTSSQLDDSMCESWQHKNISQVYTRKNWISNTSYEDGFCIKYGTKSFILSPS